MSTWLRFRSGIQGNVAFVFAIALVPLLLAIGAAVDMIRTNQAESALQGAADAAALAGGASASTTDAELETVAANYVRQNFTARVIENIDAMTITNDTASGEFTVQLSGQVQTTSFALAGLPTFNVRVTATVERSTTGALELVLALDTTASMSTGGKLASLKTAAGNLVDTVMVANDVKVGLVPFSDYMKVGVSRRNEMWLTVPADETRTGTGCDYTYPDKYNCEMVTSTCYADGIPNSCIL